MTVQQLPPNRFLMEDVGDSQGHGGRLFLAYQPHLAPFERDRAGEISVHNFGEVFDFYFRTTRFEARCRPVLSRSDLMKRLIPSSNLCRKVSKDSLLAALRSPRG